MAITAKICGLNDPASVDAAVSNGAAYMGFVFYPSSPPLFPPLKIMLGYWNQIEETEEVIFDLDGERAFRT